MEKDFQTSFIPKKPIMPEAASASRPAGFFVVISIFILFTVIIATGGLFFYKGVLAKNITRMESELNAAKNRFEPAKIQELQLLDKRLNGATQVLAGHIAISPIFKALQDVTMKTIRYTKFGYTLAPADSTGTSTGVQSNKGQRINVKMRGQATGYLAIALQADLFSLDKSIIDPAFSNLSLDSSGNVLFDLEFSVDPTLVDYKQTLLTKEDSVSSDSTLNTLTIPPSGGVVQ